MEVQPVVITSDNFATPAMRAAMDDPEQVKLFIFTVQALLKPESKVGRRTHKFQEGLGEAFYAHLQSWPISWCSPTSTTPTTAPPSRRRSANLRPRVLLGLTATPHKRTPPEPDHLPLPAGRRHRRQARQDPGARRPQGRPERSGRPSCSTACASSSSRSRRSSAGVPTPGCSPIDPIMLVIAPTIAEAEGDHRHRHDPELRRRPVRRSVLTVHSDSPDEALAALDRLEDADNPYRIVISVGMLKEGWDVKNVYVIASMRASVSEHPHRADPRTRSAAAVRALHRHRDPRHPGGARPRAVRGAAPKGGRAQRAVRRLADPGGAQARQPGSVVPVTETTQVQAPVASARHGLRRAPGRDPAPCGGARSIRSVEEHTAEAEEQVAALKVRARPAHGSAAAPDPAARDDRRSRASSRWPTSPSWSRSGGSARVSRRIPWAACAGSP